jgi:hypothetical protein
VAVGTEERLLILPPESVPSRGHVPATLLDIAIQPIDTFRGRVYNDPTFPRCNSFNMHTLGAPSQPPSRGGLCRGDASGDPAPAAVRRFQNG